MKYRNYKPYRKGVWKWLCPVTGIVYYSDQAHRRWDGQRVGPDVELSRHPQELLKIKPEDPLPWIKPTSDPEYVVDTCPINGQSARAGYGVAGCMVSGLDLPITTVVTPLGS